MVGLGKNTKKVHCSSKIAVSNLIIILKLRLKKVHSSPSKVNLGEKVPDFSERSSRTQSDINCFFAVRNSMRPKLYSQWFHFQTLELLKIIIIFLA